MDVLWVVDNSGSMGDEQQALAANFDEFIRFFVGLELDFHMSIVTTDLEDPSMQGRFQGTPTVLNAATPDLINTFKTNVNVGDTGSGVERGLEAARLALSEPLLSGYNTGFLRDDAFLAIIFVSDENDGGSEADAPLQDSVSTYVTFFQNLKGAENVNLSVIIGDVPNGCDNGSNNAKAGYRYEEAANAVGGLIESICAEDFGPVLAELGEFIGGLVTAFPLTYTPIPDTVEVRLDGVIFPPGPTTWEYKQPQNVVQFAPDAIPPECTEVKISYSVSPDTQVTEVPGGGGQDLQCPAAPVSGDFDLEGGSIACAMAQVDPAVPSSAFAGTLLALLAGLLWWRRRR